MQIETTDKLENHIALDGSLDIPREENGNNVDLGGMFRIKILYLKHKIC